MAGVPSRQLTTQEYAGDMNNFSPRKQQPQQQRQLLSCTKCRARKVKCDRTKPCSACCVRGSPRDCHFITEDGNYTPIRQSYELRKLCAENLRLKERLNSLRISVDGEDLEHAQAMDSQSGEKPPSWHKRKQQSFQPLESRDSIYFGSPGLTTVINEFASTNTSISTTLAHVMPHPADVFVMGSSSTYPFATIFSASLEDCIPQLLGCLPVKDNMLRYLSAFEHQVGAHIPVAITKFEVERFLSHAKENSQRCPTMLGLLLAVIALGAQHSVWGRNGESWYADVMRAETRAGNVYIAAAMQALRLASFMHRPSLLAIQVLVMIGKYLINSGKYLDAFTLFGTTIRLAHSIGLHCHPKYLEPSPPTARDVATRQKIWWYMLRVDEEFSMTLGRPLGISGIGTCCWPQELTTDPNIVRFGEYINHFTLLARQILSSDRLTNPRIDEFTDALRTLSETLPETLRFDDSWANSKIDLHLGSWPLSVMATGQQAFNSCMILLLDAIERRTITYGSSKAEEALHVFKILKSNHVHIFAGCAVDKIEKGFKELHDTITQTNDPDYQARVQQWNNKIISGTRQDKAMLGSGGVETVMGRTGMLLIEGADLQAFVKEEFSPTSWDMPCLTTDSKRDINTSSYHSEGKRVSELKAEISNEHSQTRQSPNVDEESGLHRANSLLYASEKLVIAMGNDCLQPHGCTASRSSTDSLGSREESKLMTSEHHGWQMSRDRRGVEPLHLDSQWHEPDGRGYNGWQYHGSPNACIGEEQHTNLLRTSIDAQQNVQSVLRHNSYPVLSQSVACSPLLRPTQSSPNNVEQSPGPQLVSPYFYPQAHSQQTHQQQNLCIEGFSSLTRPFSRHAVNTPVSGIAEVPMGASIVHGNTQWHQGQILYPVPTQPYHAGISSASNFGMNIEEWQHEW
ncbi:hypothetical protein PTT_14122 [Pyrenophora teres f. teres 0-1]|uniref:Zn(2)-C6 fungal-type domain-containing protein n=1 Tax=Pyrenophora teres f. teres (strain 0-1) TaxID=861557 RepID=E3RXJ3_PYRTT|nr:hypothetical protein PTT_14122 [Pyrenophora teres f. teres 0-1]